MALLDLLPARLREVTCTMCKETYPASMLESGDEDCSTTFMSQYLEEVRRSPRHRCGKINARAMEGGTQQNRTAGLQQENPRTMRRNTTLCLGQELAYRTQQRIVRRAAWDFERLEGRSRVSMACGRLLRSERCGSCRGLSRDVPGVLYRKDKLDQEGKQTE